MTSTQTYLFELPEETKQLFVSIYGNVQQFYTTVYLITRNEHLTEQEKPEQYAERLQTIRAVKTKIENQLTEWELNGPDIVADISSDYFEDFVNYREFESDITNDEFVTIIRKLM